MVAQFDGKVVHHLYSTSSLVHHMEWVARLIILDYLEDDEEGMGSRVSVAHMSPTLPGMKVKLTAVVCELIDNRVNCEVMAATAHGLIAKGRVEQRIVKRAWIETKMEELAKLEASATAVK